MNTGLRHLLKAAYAVAQDSNRIQPRPQRQRCPAHPPNLPHPQSDAAAISLHRLWFSRRLQTVAIGLGAHNHTCVERRQACWTSEHEQIGHSPLHYSSREPAQRGVLGELQSKGSKATYSHHLMMTSRGMTPTTCCRIRSLTVLINSPAEGHFTEACGSVTAQSTANSFLPSLQRSDSQRRLKRCHLSYRGKAHRLHDARSSSVQTLR